MRTMFIVDRWCIMAQKFSLKSAEQVRQTTTMVQQKKIKQLYEKLYQDVTKQVAGMGNDNIRKQNIVLLQRDINNRINLINQDIQSGIIRDIRIVSNEVVQDTRVFLKQCGFKDSDIHSAFEYVPDMIVRNMANGNIYQNGWRLSEAIWGHSKQTQYNLNRIISMGTAEGKSAYQVAKDIEKYVNPKASKPSRVIEFQKYKRDSRGKLIIGVDGKPIPDGKPKKFYFGSVDYNAQRLARTMISHAYQQSFENVNRNDPFVTEYIWHSAGLHGRTCSTCLDRDGKHFKKDELPLDHPNGMCTFEAVIPDSMSDIADKIGKWYQSPVGTYPEIDRYAMDFMI